MERQMEGKMRSSLSWGDIVVCDVGGDTKKAFFRQRLPMKWNFCYQTRDGLYQGRQFQGNYILVVAVPVWKNQEAGLVPRPASRWGLAEKFFVGSGEGGVILKAAVKANLRDGDVLCQ